jgi:hypothetical protein
MKENKFTVLKNDEFTQNEGSPLDDELLYDIKTKKNQLFERCRINDIKLGRTKFDVSSATDYFLHTLTFTVPSLNLECLLKKGYSYRVSEKQ